MSKMLKSSGGIGAATLASRVLGLVRDQFFAAFMGTHGVAAAFSYAFMVPNLFRRLLGEGALTAAFIPIFKAKEKNEGDASMWQAANAVISGLLVAAPAIVLYAMLLISLLLLGGGWDEDTRLMLRLMRLMFPYMMLACLGAIFMGILNARGHFFIPALSPAILNIVLIASVWWLAPHLGQTTRTQVFALAIGVLAAGVAQALFQMPAMRREGFRYHWVSPWRDPTTREVVAQMIPSAIGVAAFQINVLLTQTLAFGENKSIVAEFFYAVRMMELPQGVIGLSLTTFLLPTLSALAVDKNYGQFRATLRQGVNYLIFLNLLASVLLFALAEPIIRLLFERGKFNADSTQAVSFGLMCLVPGLVSFSLVNILARAFYALQDIQTPMRISVFCLAANVLLTVFFLFRTNLEAGALGIANSLSSVCNMSLLFYALRKKLRTLEMAESIAQLPRLALAGLLAGLTAWGLRWHWTAQAGHATLLLKLGEVFLPMTAASAVYFLLTLWWKVPSAREIAEFVLARARAVSTNARP
ncbi:MAG: murein biosynthesis integral membrane protein MurJ [Verrucomicrobiota bacterium]|jgi:putative peptidoglycan lipid II flippase